MKKYGKRFMLGWILSSILMFATSYLWHGVVLNDFERISYPFEIYLVSAGVVYLVIGFLMSRIFIAEFLDRYSEKAVARGLLTGIVMGVIVFMSALVFGVSFSSITDLKFLVLDFVWQVVEQTVGGLAVGLIYLLVFEFIPQPMEEENSQQPK
jgi:MFS family permease